MRAKLLIITVCVSLCSCGSTGNVYTSVDKNELKQTSDIACFYPFSYIDLISDGNAPVWSDTLSWKSELNHRGILLSHNKDFKITTLIPIAEEEAQQALEEEVNSLLQEIPRYGLRRNPIPPVMDSLLALSGKRFGLITVNAGFTRTKSNYGKQVLNNVGTLFLSAVVAGVVAGLTGYETETISYASPIKYSSTVYAVLVDGLKGEVVFFNQSVSEVDPLNQSALDKQITKLLKGIY